MAQITDKPSPADIITNTIIAVGTGYAVITAEDHDSSLTIVNEYDSYA